MANVQEILDLISGNVSNKEEELIRKAYDFAEKAHKRQVRLSGDPYFFHVF